MIENFHKLNDSDKFIRLHAVKALAESIKTGEIKRDVEGKGICNNIYTTYSFSPYTPSKAAFMGYMSGLETIGIIDNNSVGGAKEFLAACDMLGIAATFSAECLVDMGETKLCETALNFRIQPKLAYCTLKGIPHQSIERFSKYFEYYTEKRIERLKKMAEKYNEILAINGLTLDFEKDVMSLATVSDGGTVTIDHLLLAVANKLLEKYNKGQEIIDYFIGELELELDEEQKKFLKDKFNPSYELDMADALKSDLAAMWIGAKDECPSIKEIAKISKETGAILTYPCSGDESLSEEFFKELKDIGFKAVSYESSKLGEDRIKEISTICEKLEMLQLSGDFIDRPRNSFTASYSNTAVYDQLKETSWAIIGHEKAASVNEEFGIFSNKIIEKFPTLKERVAYFSYLAKKCQSV